MAAASVRRWICSTESLPPVKAGRVSIQRHFRNMIPGSAKWSASFSTATSVPSIRLTRTSRHSFTRETDSNSSRASKVDPHFTALLYAGDRFEFKPRLESALQAGKIVLVDRYIGSNLAHQTARVAPEKRAEFRRWIERLEYGIYDLPREDLILYLRVPPHEAQRLVAKKSRGQEIPTDLHHRKTGHFGSEPAPPRAGCGHVRPPRTASPVGGHRVFRRGPRSDALAQRNRPRRSSRRK